MYPIVILLRGAPSLIVSWWRKPLPMSPRAAWKSNLFLLENHSVSSSLLCLIPKEEENHFPFFNSKLTSRALISSVICSDFPRNVVLIRLVIFYLIPTFFIIFLFPTLHFTPCFSSPLICCSHILRKLGSRKFILRRKIFRFMRKLN